MRSISIRSTPTVVTACALQWPAMDGDAIRVTGSLALPRGEIELRFSRSSGPGGQHAQSNETRVEAVFDVDASATLTDAQKARIVERIGPVVRAIAQDERSQSRNRELALERLAEQLREALKVRRPRRDEADEGVKGAAARREKAPRHDQAAAPAARGIDSPEQGTRVSADRGLPHRTDEPPGSCRRAPRVAAAHACDSM